MYQGNTLSLIPLNNGIVELNFHNAGSVNVFNNETVAELAQATKLLEHATDITGLIATSSKSVFIVGADITEFLPRFKLSKEEQISSFAINNDNIHRLENLPFPSVVAINGFALGGGLEFCLGCDYRVMSTATKIGLPETGLGLIPGWGGTVRLPRIAGVEQALNWMVSGRHQNAEQALAVGAVDKITSPESLRESALVLLTEAIANIDEVTQRRQLKLNPVSEPNIQTIAEGARSAIGAKIKHFPAQSSIIDLVEQAASKHYKEALYMEAECFYSLTRTPQAKAMIGNFLNQQYLVKVAKKHAAKADKTVDKALVLGAGIMGGGISYISAIKNIATIMKDINQPALDLGMGEAKKLTGKQVARGRMSETQQQAVLNSITPCLEYPNLDDVDIAVEAVVENESIKKQVFADLENRISSDSLIVSNTSTISINRLASELKHPENFCGMHFFNPVHAMPLVEIIRGEKTSDQTIGAVVAYALAMGKQPVVVNDCPAFLVNRVLFPYYFGFEGLIRQGVDFREIDRVMEHWGWPMGPAYLADVIGMDTMVHCVDVLSCDFPDRMKSDYTGAMQVIYDNQRLGQKSGSGFYDYGSSPKGTKSFDTEVLNLIAPHQTNQDPLVSDDEIMQRCMLPMAIEMARCLEENIVASPAESDIAIQYGLGFPNFKGGICCWMDEIGMDQIVSWADQYPHLGKLFEATPTMREMAANKETYYK